jgi:predicted nucleic acid-binding protein
MSVFVDTGVFYAHHDEDAPRHGTARAVFDELLGGEYGRLVTNDYVLDEAVTLTRQRTGSFTASKTIADRILGRGEFPSVVECEQVSERVVSHGLAVYEQYDDHDLSFTDAVVVATCESAGIDRVCSFDDDFDGIVDRLDPTTVD